MPCGEEEPGCGGAQSGEEERGRKERKQKRKLCCRLHFCVRWHSGRRETKENTSSGLCVSSAAFEREEERERKREREGRKKEQPVFLLPASPVPRRSISRSLRAFVNCGDTITRSAVRRDMAAGRGRIGGEGKAGGKLQLQ